MTPHRLEMKKKMTIDQLSGRIRAVSDQKEVRKLADLLMEWKDDDATAEDLADAVEHYLGYAWFQRDADHSAIYSLWAAFKAHAIAGIGGMSMNERLYWFGLLHAFDACRDRDSRDRIYAKLMAAP